MAGRGERCGRSSGDVGLHHLLPLARSVNSALCVCCHAAVAVTIPHIQFRHTQSSSANRALDNSAKCSLRVV
jgi:hypothetical protein